MNVQNLFEKLKVRHGASHILTTKMQKGFVSNIIMTRQVSRSQSAVQSITQVRATDGFDVVVFVVVVDLLLAVIAAFAAQATVQKTCLKTQSRTWKKIEKDSEWL